MKDKLIIFAFDFPPSTGGIARLSHAIAMGQRSNFKEVTILTPSSFTSNDKHLKVVTLPRKRIKCEWAAYRYLNALTNKEDYAVVCGLWHPEAMLSVWAKMPNVFVLAHGAEFLPRGKALKKRLWLPYYGKNILERATKVVANSTFTKERVLQIASKSNVIAIPLGVDESHFFPLENDSIHSKLIISTVSRLQKHKGHLQVLEAIHKLPIHIREQIEWHIAGTGSYEKTIKAKVTELNLDEVVKFHGFIPDEKLNAFYNSSDLFVLFSQEEQGAGTVEGFGLVFLEAQSSGIPVIGTRTGGIEDAVKPNEGGWLLASENVSGLSELLVHLITHPNELKEQGKLARDRVLREGTWKHYQSLIFKAMQETR